MVPFYWRELGRQSAAAMSNGVERRRRTLAKISEAHSIDALGDPDFGVFAIADGRNWTDKREAGMLAGINADLLRFEPGEPQNE